MERAGPLHRLGRRRPLRAWNARGRSRRRAARGDATCSRTSSTPRCSRARSAPPSSRSRRPNAQWIPVRRSWRLNERHYGDLQGKSKEQTRLEYGDEQYMLWRRSYDVPPPPLSAALRPGGGPRPAVRAASRPMRSPPPNASRTSLVRMLPYWYDAIVPDLLAGQLVLVSAHGNSLRALVKHLDGIPDAEIAELNLPTGVPLLYELDGQHAAGRAGRSPLRSQRHLPRPRRGHLVDRERREPGPAAPHRASPSLGAMGLGRPAPRDRGAQTVRRRPARARAGRARRAGSSSPTRCRTRPRPSPGSRRPPRSGRNRRSPSTAT